MPWPEWYNSLAKPSWTPAPATNGLIWRILSPIIDVSFRFVFIEAIRRRGAWLVRSGNVVVMDNLSSHKRRGVREALASGDATHLLLPPI